MKDRSSGGGFVRMYLNRLRSNLCDTLALAFILVAASSIRAAVTVDSASAAGTEIAPPAYPDHAHVSNGCHLSTITYLAKFKAEYPAESGEPLVIKVVNYDGAVTSHTVTVLTWRNQLWCRDEYFGVFTLNCAVANRPGHERLVSRVQTLLERHEKKLIRAGNIALCPVPPKKMSAEQRTMEVKVMAEIIPFPTTVYWVRDGVREIPFAFFRPAVGQVAVYDPQHGTCLAECSIQDEVKIVSAVVSKLGYTVERVRPDFSNVRTTLVASNLARSGGAQ